MHATIFSGTCDLVNNLVGSFGFDRHVILEGIRFANIYNVIKTRQATVLEYIGKLLELTAHD